VSKPELPEQSNIERSVKIILKIKEMRRSNTKMKNIISVLIISSSLLLNWGCKNNVVSSNNNTDSLFIAFKDVENYGIFQVIVNGTKVVNTESEWLNLWKLYWNNFDGNGNKTPPPQIDFDSKTVIGVFWGDECTYSGCQNESPSIKSIFIYSDTLYVDVGELVDLGFCDACVKPLHLVEIDKQILPVKFIGYVP
jgi:hypothetical protein